MKKIMVVMAAIALGYGAAYAGEKLYNGVTDFTGRSYDLFEIDRADTGRHLESSSAGGLREIKADARPVTEKFIDTGRSYDVPPMNPGLGWEDQADTGSRIERSSAGGLREIKTGGMVDTGRSYDVPPMNPGLGW